MKTSALLCVLVVAFTYSATAQLPAGLEESTSVLEDSPVANYLAEEITPGDIERHLRVIASDEYEGRETGTAGNLKAAEYIAEHFRSLGLEGPLNQDNSYFQPAAFTRTGWDTVGITIGGTPFKHLWDFLSYPTESPAETRLTDGNVVFVGYGIDDERYSDYQNVDVAGKTILIYQGEPFDDLGNSLITGSNDTSEWATDWRKKLETARMKGAKMVLLIEHQLQKKVSQNRRFLVGSRLTMGYPDEAGQDQYPAHAFVSTTMAETLMGGAKKKVVKAREKISQGKASEAVVLDNSISAALIKYQRVLESQNVLGYLPGSDETLRDELVIVTGHYDHLGKRGDDIFNGADDNGSGTSTILDIAQSFAAAHVLGKGPRRSVLFMLVTGEEKGLLGSRYYVENPVFPLEQTVANVNVDMIGRVDKAHEDDPRYVYIIGADRLSTELHQINEEANRKYTGLSLDYTFNAEDDPNQYYYRSDHYNFAERGIPAIFYFSGVHEDYHRPGDTADKIMYEKTARIGRLIFHTIWELANRDRRIVVDVPGSGERQK